jgi:hypothetical protein
MLKVGDTIIVVHAGKKSPLKVGDITTVKDKGYTIPFEEFMVYSDNDNRQEKLKDIIVEKRNYPKSQIKAGDSVEVIGTYDNWIIKTGTFVNITKVWIITNEGWEAVEDRLGGFLLNDTIVEKYKEPTSKIKTKKPHNKYQGWDTFKHKLDVKWKTLKGG